MSSPLCVFSACAWVLNLCFFSASEPYKRLVFWISFDGQGPCLLSRHFVLCQQGLRDSGTASFLECPPPHVFHAWPFLLSRPFVVCLKSNSTRNPAHCWLHGCYVSEREQWWFTIVSVFCASCLAVGKAMSMSHIFLAPLLIWFCHQGVEMTSTFAGCAFGFWDETISLLFPKPYRLFPRDGPLV